MRGSLAVRDVPGVQREQSCRKACGDRTGGKDEGGSSPSGNAAERCRRVSRSQPRIRTPDRTLLTVPNAQFSTMPIENFTRRDKMLFHFMFNLRRDTTPDQVRRVLESIVDELARAESMANQLAKEAPVAAKPFGDMAVAAQSGRIALRQLMGDRV